MNDSAPAIEPEVESPIQTVNATVTEQQTRAEIDVAISTAKRYPRSVQAFLHRAESLATVTPEIAASCEYAKPVGGQKVKGPSARLAEIVAASYGNIRVQARVISETHDEIVAQGVAHDLETNVAQSTEVTVSLLKADRKTRVGPEQVATARASACAKARRNATFLVVPLAIVQPIIVKARQVAAGDAATLPQRRTAMLEWFANKGVKRSTILEWLGVKAEGDIGLEQMADLVAAQNTAKEEGVDLSAIFGRKPESSRFSDDVQPTGAPGKAALDKANAEAAKREAERPAPTHADAVALAKQLPDESVLAILDTFEATSIGAMPADKLPSLVATLTAAVKAYKAEKKS